MSITYRYTCVDESVDVYETRSCDQGVPSQCKNDAGHAIDAGSVTTVGSSHVHYRDRDPTAADDASQDYQFGDRWTNVATKRVFANLGIDTGSAIWVQVSVQYPDQSHVFSSSNAAWSETRHVGSEAWRTVAFMHFAGTLKTYGQTPSDIRVVAAAANPGIRLQWRVYDQTHRAVIADRNAAVVYNGGIVDFQSVGIDQTHASRVSAAPAVWCLQVKQDEAAPQDRNCTTLRVAHLLVSYA